MYGADAILTMLAFPGRFQAADFLNLVNKFVGAKNTNGSATYPVGDFPEVVKQDGTAGQFCSGNDLYCHYATGDGRISVPLALYLYWKRTGDLAPYRANVAAIITALAIPPRNGTTGCITIVAGQEDIPGIGYLEQMRPIGDVADASVWMAYDYEALYLMATAAGDTSNASIFNTQFTSLQTCVTTTLTDGSTKMLWFANGAQMHELDIVDSTLAAYPLLGSSVGPLLSGTQITAIGTWLDSNYSSLVDTQGYAKMVNACDVVGKIPSGGGAPYTSDGTTTTSYQCAFWATFGGYFADILSPVDLASAQSYMAAFLNGMSPGVEHYNSGTPALGNAPLLITAGQSIRLASELIPMDVPPITTVLCAADGFGRCTNYLPGDVNVGNFHDPAVPIPFLLKQTGTYAYSGFNTIDAYLFPNAANGATLGMALGTAISSNNVLYLSFHPNGSGSTSNFGSLDLWGHNNELTWWPSGDVGVGGASTDQNKLFWVGSTAQFNVDASGNAATSGTMGAAAYNQHAASNTGGTCTMSSGTSCTITLGHTYTTPVCIVTQQSGTLTGGVVGCTVSGTTVTITAATSNSEAWGAFVFGNPN
jgi:hypothetical protein